MMKFPSPAVYTASSSVEVEVSGADWVKMLRDAEENESGNVYAMDSYTNIFALGSLKEPTSMNGHETESENDFCSHVRESGSYGLCSMN